MARKQQSWLWLPLVIGLVIGVAVAATTDQWWWSTVGALGGALVGAIGAGKLRWPKSSR